ncbi:hypothetical protein QQF64_019630 [Cirrhinus molitorella]|uniref:Uncharacterized protein n=1 Tax=Cirrhinus molitorella TaxID=172907 RepID=A0ABR3LJC1_9TELE
MSFVIPSVYRQDCVKGILPNEMYLHFLSFSVAMVILVCPRLVQEHSKYAHDLLQYFTGKEFLVYNTHAMLHIARDAGNFGGLENCSAFMFEDYLQTPKRMVRSGRNPLVQVTRRPEERSKQKKTTVEKISTKTQDCAYVLSGGQCCEVLQGGQGTKSALGPVYGQPEPLFTSPCTSFLTGAYKYKKTTTLFHGFQEQNSQNRQLRLAQKTEVRFFCQCSISSNQR